MMTIKKGLPIWKGLFFMIDPANYLVADSSFLVRKLLYKPL
jgi:hypothetical protein